MSKADGFVQLPPDHAGLTEGMHWLYIESHTFSQSFPELNILQINAGVCRWWQLPNAPRVGITGESCLAEVPVLVHWLKDQDLPHRAFVLVQHEY